MKKYGLLLVFTLIFVTACDKDSTGDFEGNSGSFTDTRDNQTYQWVRIGDQIWMAENFAYAPESGDYWAFQDDVNNVPVYGYLYSWNAAKELAPEGWHLPNNAEWSILINYLGGEDVAGGKMKTTDTGQDAGVAYWMEPNTGATDESGFSAVPAGVRYASGSFSFLHGHCRYWEADKPRFYSLDYSNAKISFSSFTVTSTEGYSVRYIKDE